MALRLGIVCSMLPMFRSKLALHRPFSSALSLSLARQLGFIPSSPVARCRRCVLSSQSHVQKSQLSIVDEDGDEILHLRGIEDRGTGNADAGTSGRLGDDFGVCTISGRDLWLKGLGEEAERMYLSRAGSVQASTNLKIESWEQGYVCGGQWKISSPLGCSSCGDDFWTGIVAVAGTAASSSCAASCFSDIACESQRFPNLVSDGTELIGGVWGRRSRELGSVSCRTSRSQSRFFSAVGSECHWLSSPGRFPRWFRDGASQSPRRGTAPRYMYSTGAPVSTEFPVQTDGSCDGEYGAVKPLREIPTSTSSRPTDESENSSEGLGTSGIPSLDEGKLQMWRGDSVPEVDQKPKSESELRSGCGPCYVDGGEPSTVSADDEGGESQMQAAVLKALEQSLGSPLGREPQVPRPKPLVIVISGPSGVGKDVVIKRLQELRKDVHFVVTATTRPQRPGEVDGLDYFFVSKKEFVSMVENGELLEHALVYGDYKGIPKQQVRDCMARGTDVVLRVDVQGAATVRSILGSNAVFIFLVAENETSLVKRLLTRKTETLDKVILRIATAREELKRLDEFDYAVVNADGQLDRTVSSICCIIDAEKARVKQRVATI